MATSLADGLWSGIYRAFQEDSNLEIVNHSKPSSGFVRTDAYDWNSAIDDILKDETYQIAVVMFGANDNQAIRSGKDLLKPGTDAWRDAYGQTVEALIKKLRAAAVAVYWVGLPILRSPDQSEDAEAMNEVFREKAFINGAKFIDTWGGFTDEFGRYSAYGPDMSGQVRRLRDDDGVHFTMRGYLKLAHFAEKEIRRDLSLAKLERTIPLAGSEDEQAKVMGRVVSPGKLATPSGKVEETLPPKGTEAQGDEAAPRAGQAAEASPAEPRKQGRRGRRDSTRDLADDARGRTEPRAARSGCLPAGQRKYRERSARRADGAGLDLNGERSVVSSSKPRLPLTQQPYYKVLIQGQQLKPKAGRADDFTWPRS